MRSEDFDAWIERHTRVFGLVPEFGLRTMSLWFNLFTAASYTVAELNEATDWLALNAPPAKYEHHLWAIQSRIRGARAVDFSKEAERHEWGECTQCEGSGMVTVPHPKGLRDGLWVQIRTTRSGASFYTLAVYCTCALGNWKHGKAGHERLGDRRLRCLTLGEYERLNPDWRSQVEGRRRERVYESKLSHVPGPLDDVLARIQKQAQEAMR